MIKITFLDGSVRVFDNGITPLQVASSISTSLSKKCLAAKINNQWYDLTRPIGADAAIELITSDTPGLEPLLNHSCAHLLAGAIKDLYPHAKFGVGPAIEEGFYYDIDLAQAVLSEDDFPLIEKKMLKLVEENLPMVRREVSKNDALEIFKNDEYKVELINELPNDEIITIYQQGNFIDLCRGPHINSTKWLRYFKLQAISGAYWRGNALGKQLIRIYGTCFINETQLKEHLALLEERKKRDHRRLGKDLELFMINEHGPGFPFWLPNGMILRRNLENFWYDIHIKEGYQLIQTPIMLNKELWEVSGHWYNYKENMYVSQIDDLEFAIKPMNCPGGLLVYKNNLHSYRDFPLRLGELGLVHRHEASGALNGLFRVRNFTQDDAHVFITEEQIEDEIGRIIDLFAYVYKVFDLSYHIELSTRPEEKYIGAIETWERAEKALQDTLEHKKIPYVLNPGDGAFYGPKLDFKLKDSMNRIWQCGTIQLDMNLPERFDLTYISDTGEKKRPTMIHRALFGSLERFIGIITEHYGGAFPLWLAPKQIVIIPVNNASHSEYAKEVAQMLKNAGIRESIDQRDEKMNYKIRESQTKKIPYTIIIGDNEVQGHSITYRRHGSTVSQLMELTTFVEQVANEVKNYQ